MRVPGRSRFPYLVTAPCMDPNVIAEFIGVWGYPALLLLLLVTAVGSPVPEDLLLLVAGYLVSVGVFNWSVLLPLSCLGVIGSDSLLYVAGRQIRVRATGGRRRVGPARLHEATRWFSRGGTRLVLYARLIPGTRAVVFVTAGLRGVPPVRFLLLDALGAAIWVPLLLVAGGRVGGRVGGLEEMAVSIARGAVWLIGGAALLAVLWWLWGTEESKL